MPQSRPPSEPPPGTTQPPEADVLRHLLRSPGYLKLLAFCALIGVPVSLASFWFLVALHKAEHALWADLPEALGWDVPPWWWPLPLLLVAGTAVGLIATHLHGGGGHIPAAGVQMGDTTPAVLPGVVLAAAASLPFGAVLGPEAPLIALGTALALLFRDLSQAPATRRAPHSWAPREPRRPSPRSSATRWSPRYCWSRWRGWAGRSCSR
ncbi:hypothetical protein WKI68_21975 [Streptomyces sp. MS1.HAVA.3]|uniref:Chloride channel protein n=1 Tax=Streptomyces caledonius TaxID=3134107 RepID=A0ABU8U617_9ACTN